MAAADSSESTIIGCWPSVVLSSPPPRYRRFPDRCWSAGDSESHAGPTTRSSKSGSILPTWYRSGVAARKRAAWGSNWPRCNFECDRSAPRTSRWLTGVQRSEAVARRRGRFVYKQRSSVPFENLPVYTKLQSKDVQFEYFSFNTQFFRAPILESRWPKSKEIDGACVCIEVYSQTDLSESPNYTIVRERLIKRNDNIRT